jgi:cupin 2 domain-containing protein
MELENILQHIPGQLERELFDNLLETPGLRIERIVSQGHQSPASQWYDQGSNEWVMLVQGAAVLGFENQPPRQLAPGDFVNIPAHTRHRVDWTDPEQVTIWLAIHY